MHVGCKGLELVFVRKVVILKAEDNEVHVSTPTVENREEPDSELQQ